MQQGLIIGPSVCPALLADAQVCDKAWLCGWVGWHDTDLYSTQWAPLRMGCSDVIIKLGCYMIRSTRPPMGSQRPLGWPQVTPVTDSPREVWWTVSHNYTVLFLSCDVKTTKFNQYSPMVLTSLNTSNSRFQKCVMFWMRCHHGIVLWCCSGAACDTMLCS